MSRTKELKELSPEALESDSWNAVYLRLPEAPSSELVTTAHWTAEYCYEAAMNRAENPEWQGRSAYEPLDSEYGPTATAAEHAKTALSRMEELERIDPTLVRMLPARNSTEITAPIGNGPQTSRENEERSEEQKQPADANQPLDRPGATADDRRAHKMSNVEISDRMSRMLDAVSVEGNDLDDSDDHDQSGDRSFDGGGHSRSR